MAWRMPAETAPHERTWMAFPREGQTLGSTVQGRQEGYEAWAIVARAVAEFEPVTMIVDPTEKSRARNLLGDAVELVEMPLDEFWMRDVGPTFVVDDSDPTRLAAIDWIFNGWGAPDWAEWEKSALVARAVASHVGASVISSLLVNEGGGIHTDGAGTILATETVQLDPRRNPFADRGRVEEEFGRTLGAQRIFWVPRGLTRDYEEFGTNGHVDIVATFAKPGHILLHDQGNPDHPDHDVMQLVREALIAQAAAADYDLLITVVSAPDSLRNDDGWVDWSYINHYAVNGGVIACGFGDPRAGALARETLSEAYPGRDVVTVEARPIFDRGGGIHCITQQQPVIGGAR